MKMVDQEISPPALPLVMSALPEIIHEEWKGQFTGWKIYFDKDFLPTLKQGQNWDKELVNTISQYLKTDSGNTPFPSFYFQYSIKTVPFLVGLFFAHKEIRLAGPHLHYELFLKDSSPMNSAGEAALRTHIERFLELDQFEFPSVWERITKVTQLKPLHTEKLSDDFYRKYEEMNQSLLQSVREYKPGIFEKITDFGLTLTAQFALIRIHLLKFLAVLPSLDHDLKGGEVKRLFLETCRRLIEDSEVAKKNKEKGDQGPLPSYYIKVIKILSSLAERMSASSLASLIRSAVKQMAKRFIAGENIEKSKKSLHRLRKSGRDATLDQLGELVVAENEADFYCDKVLDLIAGIGKHVPRGTLNKAGIPSAHVSIKMSALTCYFNPLAEEETFRYVYPRLKKILLKAKEEEVFIHVDAEHFHHRDLVFTIFRRTLLETPEFADFKWVGIVIQTYLRDVNEHFNEVLDLACKRKIVMPIRLVKGAYWDAETIEARAHSFNAPQFLNKEETDLHFRQMIIKTLENSSHLQLCLASHNLSDHCFAESYAELYALKAPKIEHQCLHMTYEALGQAMVKFGWPVRNYIPIGDLLVGMAYLVRRIMENSSQVGILTIMRSDKTKKNFPLPEDVHLEKKSQKSLCLDPSEQNLSPSFFNITPVRLYLKKEKEEFFKVHQHFLNHEMNKIYPNLFAVSGTKIEITDPSKPDRVVGLTQFAQKEDVEEAVALAYQTYEEGGWAKAAPIYRASFLIKTAQLLLVHRLELAALIIHEAGKVIAEALGDVDEAIDFLNFYAREEVRLHQEQKYAQLVSRGVIAVISPWNFPLAIPCGMVASSLVAGNTVILKSAEETPLVAQKLVDFFHQAGVPQSALIHLPGPGEEVGSKLVLHEKVAGIVFTGSKEVGKWIYQTASQRLNYNPLYHYRTPVKVVVEMGGKNAIIVTANAELDETVAGCLYSAFGHSGQKCSALSRILVDSSIYEKFAERFKEAAMDLKVGAADEFSTVMNPVISLHDKLRLRSQAKMCIEEAHRLGGKVLVDRSQENLPGNAIGPVVIELPMRKVLQNKTFAHQELFGPIVHLIAVNNSKEMIQLFNDVDYALTGGIFCQSQDDMEFFTKHLEAGNLYVNRSCTGARVNVEPFGGFKLSGTGPKAGGKDYVRSFHYQLPNKDSLQLKIRELTKLSHSHSDSHEKISDEKLSIFIPQGIFQLLTQNGKEALPFSFDEEEKKYLQTFIDWSTYSLPSILGKKEPNHFIPGLINFNEGTLIKPQGTFIILKEKPSLKSFCELLLCLTLGIKIKLVIPDFHQEKLIKINKMWGNLTQLFYKNGIKKEMLSGPVIVDLKVKQDQLNLALAKQNSSFVIIDGSLDEVEKTLPYVFYQSEEDEVEKHQYLAHVMTSFDGNDPQSFDELLGQFLFIRSFSINTMRHGAPMALNQDHPA